MKSIRKSLAWAALAIGTLAAAQGCIPVIVGGTGVAVAMVSDRRSSGTYVAIASARAVSRPPLRARHPHNTAARATETRR